MANVIQNEIKGWKEEISPEQNSAVFLNLVSRESPDRSEMIEIYSQKQPSDWSWEDLLLILGWKYNLGNLELFASSYKGLRLNSKTKEGKVNFFREKLDLSGTEDHNAVLQKISDEFDGLGKVTASAFLLYGAAEPIYDQHCHRAIKYIYANQKYREDLKLRTPNKSVGNYEKFRFNFYRILDALDWNRNLEDIMQLDACLFSKGKKIKESNEVDVEKQIGQKLGLI